MCRATRTHVEGAFDRISRERCEAHGAVLAVTPKLRLSAMPILLDVLWNLGPDSHERCTRTSLVMCE